MEQAAENFEFGIKNKNDDESFEDSLIADLGDDIYDDFEEI